MTIHKGGNAKFASSGFPFESGDTIEEWNLVQREPNTAICSGLTGLTFIRCNLINCSVPGDSVIEHCLHVQKDFCVHLHPDWGLDAEAENCPHVVDTDEITMDSVVLDTIYHYEDTRV